MLKRCFEELFQPKINKDLGFCDCKTVKSHLDTHLVVMKQICPVCNKRLKKEFMDNRFGFVVVSGNTLSIKRRNPRYYATATLSAFDNIVVLTDGIAKEVDTRCLNTKNLKVRYLVKYDKIKYMDSEGFDTHNPLFRPFKPGLVKGYINSKNEFVIIKNV